MQLAAIGLAAALVLTGTTASAMGGGGGGAGAGVGWSYTNNPADCGGLVCFAKSRSALTAHPSRMRHVRNAAHHGLFRKSREASDLR